MAAFLRCAPLGRDVEDELDELALGICRHTAPSLQDFEACSGLPLRFVEAMSWSSCSLIDSTIDFDAPFSSLFFFSPRFADKAAPAAICWALDFAGITTSLLHVLAAGGRDTAERSCTTPGSIGIVGLRDVAE